MRIVFWAVFLFVAVCHAGGMPEMPRGIGDSIRLGMKKEEFVAKFRIEPTRCASCYRGELLAQPTIEKSTDVNRDLAAFALAMGTPSQQVDLFFEHGVLATIHLENLESLDALAAVEKKFGKGRAVQKSKDVSETEWNDGRTRMRLTKWESEYQLTLSNREGSTRAAKKK
jgi:hypothetical protein